MNAVKQPDKPDNLKAMKVFGVFTVLVLIVAVFRIVHFLAEGWEKSQWTEERITRALGISIPDDALNVHVEGERNGYGHYFTLDFDASPLRWRVLPLTSATGFCTLATTPSTTLKSLVLSIRRMPS